MNYMKRFLSCASALSVLLAVAACDIFPINPDDPGNNAAPKGAVNGLFTINGSGSQVYFSKGNLQYQASTGTWRFAEHQWDYVGGSRRDDETVQNGTVANSDNCKVDVNYSGWIDLFGWGTSGWNSGADCYAPYESSREAKRYLPGDDQDNNLTGDYANADWGVYNAISNGGNKAGLWRTLSSDEWEYVLNKRSGDRYAKATVNDIPGLILLPDGWDASVYEFKYPNRPKEAWDSHVIAKSLWENTLEPAGAVFLPAAGYRSTYYSQKGDGWVLTVNYDATDKRPHCCYWSTTNAPGYTTLLYARAYYMCAYWQEVTGNTTYDGNRSNAMSVRLVRDSQ